MTNYKDGGAGSPETFAKGILMQKIMMACNIAIVSFLVVLLIAQVGPKILNDIAHARQSQNSAP